MEALASYRVVDRIYTRKEAQEITAHIGQSVETIENLPKIETEDWNLLGQLEIFMFPVPPCRRRTHHVGKRHSHVLSTAFAALYASEGYLYVRHTQPNIL